MVCESAQFTQWLDSSAEQAPTPPPSDNTLTSAQFPYWTLAHPVVYKLRTCCLDDFIPYIPKGLPAEKFFAANAAASNPNNLEASIFYVTRRLELSDSGVAYLFRGRKYLLVEAIERPAGKFMQDNEVKPDRRQVGLYELVVIDPRDFVEYPKDDETIFMFSFNCLPKPRKASEHHKHHDLDLLCLPQLPTQGDSDNRSISKTSHVSSSEPKLTISPDSMPPLIIPCECQLIRQRQQIHKQIFSVQISRFVKYVKSLIETYATVLPPFVRSAVLRCEVGNHFSELLMRKTSAGGQLRASDPSPFPTASLRRFLTISEVSLASNFSRYSDDELQSHMDKITSEGQAQLQLNELKEMFSLLQHYSKN